MSIQGPPGVPPYFPEAHVRVRGAYTAPGLGPAGAVDGVLRAREPIPTELGLFVLRQTVAARGDADPLLPPAQTLDVLLGVTEPWPIHLVLLLLRTVADVLDGAAGVTFGALTPRCIAFDGPYLVLAPGEDPAVAEPAYVAPEQREPGAPVDARAAQYGLALIASVLFSVGRSPAGAVDGRRAARGSWGEDASQPAASPSLKLGPAVERVLRAARAPDPGGRFSTAGDFVTALEAACAEWPPSRPAAAADVGSPWPSLGSATRARQFVAVGGLVGVAALAGAGAGWYAARRPAAPWPDVPAAAPPNASANAPVVTAASPGALAERVPARGGPPRVERTVAQSLPAPSPASSDSAAPPRSDPAPRPESPAEARGAEPRPDASRDLPPPQVARRLGAAVAAVVLPSGDLLPAARVAVSSPAEFAAGGLRGPGVARAAPNAPAASQGDEAVVNTPAELVVGGQPRYPASLLAAHVDGEVVARFVVDSTGRVDPSTFVAVRSTHRLFEQAVRESLRQARFRPAESGGRRVRDTVEQTFRFAAPR